MVIVSTITSTNSKLETNVKFKKFQYFIVVPYDNPKSLKRNGDKLIPIITEFKQERTSPDMQR